jgi:predicted GNAT family N-acyltransferase
MEWKCSDFKHLTTSELYSILRARSAVFVVEFAHIHLDIDDKDQSALHIYLMESDQVDMQIQAYARLLPGDDIDPEVFIDKVFTIASKRDDDTHDQLVCQALAAAQTVWPDHAVHINVPAIKETFYNGFGFRKAAGPFLEHSTPYLQMAWRPGASHRRSTNEISQSELLGDFSPLTLEADVLSDMPRRLGALP